MKTLKVLDFRKEEITLSALKEELEKTHYNKKTGGFEIDFILVSPVQKESYYNIVRGDANPERKDVYYYRGIPLGDSIKTTDEWIKTI